METKIDDRQRLTIDEQLELFDAPSKPMSEVAKTYQKAMENWDPERSKHAAANIAKTLQRFAEISKPIASVDATRAMTSSLTKVAEATKPLYSKIASQNMSSAAETMRRSLENTNALFTTSLQESNKMFISSATNSARKASETFVLNGAATTIRQLVQPGFDANKMISGSISNAMSQSFAPAQSALTLQFKPRQEAFTSLYNTFSNISGIFQQIAEMIRSSGIIDILSGALSSFRQFLTDKAEPISRFLKSVYRGSKHLVRRGLLYMRQRWLLRKQRKLTYKQKAEIRNISLSPILPVVSFSHVEYAGSLRQRYLINHRRTANDADDLDDGFIYILAS
jgi:hypothetical protein